MIVDACKRKKKTLSSRALESNLESAVKGSMLMKPLASAHSVFPVKNCLSLKVMDFMSVSNVILPSGSVEEVMKLVS